MKLKKVLSTHLSTAELNAQRFELFQKTVFGESNDQDSSALKEQVFGRNLKTIRSAAIVVILTNSYWLIMDNVRNGAMNLSSGWALAAILLQIFFSCYMLVLPRFVKNMSGKVVQYSFLGYYICLIAEITVLAVTKNVQMLNAGTNYALAGIPLSTCFLFIIVLAPLPSKRDSYILGAVFLILFFVPAVMPGHELYNIAQQGIVRICMVVAYCHIRDVNLALSDSIQRLSVLSFTDTLTNVLNRRALDSYWESMCANEKNSYVGVLIFDIDDFKKYNDCYTHAKGNDVLKSVCRAAASVLDSDETFLFRYGGEEFVVLLMDYTESEILRCAQRIKEAIFRANIARNDGSGFDRITVTIGCAREAASQSGCKDYIIRADEQLYIGKNNGKNCFVFNGELYH